MKKCYISILSGILVGLFMLSACDNPFTNEPDSAEPSAQTPASSETRGVISARIFLPDYHTLAARQSRLIAPQTAKVRLSIGTSAWTQHGEDLVIDWDNLERVEDAPANLPGGIWTAQFPALDASVYAPGTLRIELLDADNQVITRGHNEETVTITANASTSAQFFTTPAVFESNVGSLEQGEMRFWRIYREASPATVTLTADGSWPDIVLFNSNGTFRSYYPISGTGDSTVELPSGESAAYYYIGVWADAGAVTSYNLAFSSGIMYTITGIAEAQAYLSAASNGATAADPVSLDVQLNLADTLEGWAALLDAIQTANKFIALNLSACTLSGTEFDPGTANTGESKIVSLVLPNAAKSIKAGTYDNPSFKNFTALTSVSGSAVETIGDIAFHDCAALTSVSLPAATSIGDAAFADCAALTSVSLPVATSIGSYAFEDCDALTTVSLPAVTSIGSEVFYNCAALTTVSLPVATSIGDYAFYNCDALTSVSLPVATSIGDYAFYNCDALTSVSLPAATSIGDAAFASCAALTSVSLPATLITINGNPFSGCINLATITVASGNLNYSAQDNMLLNKAGTTLIAYPSATGAVTLNTVTSIGDAAFQGCAALTSVSLPVATSIGSGAFAHCAALTSVSLPQATSIGSGAFWDCYALTTVSLPAASSIGNYAFAYTGGSSLAVTLGSTAPTLGTSMFSSVTKTVTVKVPSNATGYGALPATYSGAGATESWGDGFRGKGWDGTGFLSDDAVNSNIILTIQVE